MAERYEVFDFVISQYYKNNKDAAQRSGYSESAIARWRSGKQNPQTGTIDYFLGIALAPEFKVIKEFWTFDNSRPLQTQLKEMLGEHKNHPGIYAFYDSLGNLLYIGKAKRLLAEVGAAICREIHVKFPKGIRHTPTSRREVVRYISAYDVGAFTSDDYPKHVESLILRISKPPFNKNIGSLDRAQKPPSSP